MRAALAGLTAVLVAACSSAKPGPAAPSPATPPSASAPAPAVQTTPAPAPAPAPEPPRPPQVALIPAQVQQGDMAVLRLDKPVDGEVKVKVQGLDEQPKVYRQGARPVAFIGVPATARTGSYPVTVTWPGGEWTGNLEVIYKKFTEDRLVVTEQQEATYYDPRQADEWARLFERRSHSIDRPLWDGAFQEPLAGPLRITTYFGEIRYVNGKETGRHSGMDFGAPEGTPVYAPALGKVVLAEKLIVTGNTITLDHGMNLYTTYYHLSAIDVQVGDWVEPGQVIGKVGNTGFSTGAHLHWTATIGNTPVDPWPLTQAPPLGVRQSGPITPE